MYIFMIHTVGLQIYFKLKPFYILDKQVFSSKTHNYITYTCTSNKYATIINT